MKILLIGSGGREHAIYETLERFGAQVVASPGNPGMRHCIAEAPLEQILSEDHYDLVFFGPEAPLANGQADLARRLGTPAFGPGEAGARLESSKVFAKDFMKRYGIPTAESFVLSSREELLAVKLPIVLKADGLAGGKGVLLPKTAEELEEAARVFFDERTFGASADQVLVEELLEGPEVSLFYLLNETGWCYLGNARDHKRAYDGDLGPNTGGMGTVSPVELTAEESAQADEIAEKTYRGLKLDGIDYRGVIFIGCMRTKTGLKVLEYNVRFGDPETQVLLPRLRTDFAELIRLTATGGEYPVKRAEAEGTCVCVIVASEGYPEKPLTGRRMEVKAVEGIKHYFSGVKSKDAELITAGGRVLSVVGLADSLETARKRVYDSLDRIHFEGMWFRKDIGK